MVAIAGCLDTDLDQPPALVVAELDPSAQPPVLPLPNDLTGQPAPPTMPAVAGFSGGVDPASVRPDDVLVRDAATLAPVAAPPELDPTGARLLVGPPAGGWPAGHRFAVVLRGGSTGLRGAKGEPVVASPTFFFLRSTRPLCAAAAAGAACKSTVPLLTDAQAAALEPVRLALAPLLMALEASGVPRDDVVLAWTFTVAPPAPAGAALEAK